MIGQEAPIWAETSDSASLDIRVWPRAAAMAEVVWSEPTTSWKEAESRFYIQRERLINGGINADSVAPEWCYDRDETCRVDSYYNLQ